ncbi:methyltransferase domain-containing protein [Gluconobacter kondonii]|uniref:methyltransferase domain-containing protein n=1 Tax=Gluconobacter kondonii TaxID=941463 RepID=UPI001B8BCCC7|nr:methyltransferase domain-containing protein [Gluconobacter kondonii]MBS1052554.1 methyltransferase domain-containing protein [Gluconobacter kondonii]MBS1055946.1 methyltransferase domain-containing protein [Gluconobacter kondonii]MBS1077706.1 methyltransferase domain-containing protein [Gluconobacter kondonii]
MTQADDTLRRNSIAARFDAAEGYDAAAHIQRRCVTALMERIRTATTEQTPASILEFGCGTGFLTARLAGQFPQASLLASDLAPGMIARTRQHLSGANIHFHVMDAEHPDISGPFDLIASSLCLQWFSNRAEGLRRLCDLLAPQGRLIVATLLQGSLDEWKQACLAEGAPCGVPDYPSVPTVEAEWPNSGAGSWEVLTLHDPVGSAREFLRGLRQIGASLPRQDSTPASIAALRRAMRHFDRTSSDVTYQIGIGTFVKSGEGVGP